MRQGDTDLNPNLCWPHVKVLLTSNDREYMKQMTKNPMLISPVETLVGGLERDCNSESKRVANSLAYPIVVMM